MNRQVMQARDAFIFISIDGSMSLMFEKFTMINENTDTNIPIRVSIFISHFCFSCRSYISQQCYNINIFLPRRTKYAVNQSAYEIFEKPSSDFC